MKSVSYTHLDVYKRQHLDGEYTVFGEVVKGLDIVDKIQQVKTDRSDRPEEDVKITKVTILDLSLIHIL